MRKSTTMFDFFKRKYSNSSEVNVVLPTTNVAIPSPKNADIPILENIHSPIPENIDIPILESVDIQIPENDHIPQTKFQKVILILWIMIPEHVKKYGNIMLINVMTFDRLTLKMVHTNLV